MEVTTGVNKIRTIEEVINEISNNAQYRNGDPTYLFEGYDIENALDEILEIHKKEARPTGKWIDHSDEGYIECPFCHSATNCEGNIEELHYCFSCGANNGGK